MERPQQPKALIRLHFNKAILKKTDPAVQPILGLNVPLRYAVRKIAGKVRKVARNQVLADMAVKAAIEGNKSVLTLATSLHIPSVSQTTLPLDGTPRLAEVGDAFDSVGGKLELDAHIAMSLVPAKGSSPQELIQSATSQSKLKCLRIGNMAIREDGDPGVHERRRGQRELGPEYCWPLLVWFTEDLKTIKFTKVHAFEFNEHCIGDPNESEKWNQVKFGQIWGSFYTGLFIPLGREKWSMAKFKDVLKQHIAEDWGNLRTGMPCLPTYCFNKYDPAEYSLGLTRWPSKGIDVAVRCVNHYEGDGMLKDLSFRRDIRLVIKQEDTMDDIREFLDDEINARETEDGVKIDSARLFEREHRNEWEWEFWVMPQRGPTKLYRLTDGAITQFLDDSEETRRKDRKVFVEAHVMPKSKGESTGQKTGKAKKRSAR